MNSAHTPLSTVLKGITVLDLTRLLPGPMATRHLADLGATIIKIQAPDPALADYAKTMGTQAQMDGDATFFYRYCNADKQDLTLDLKQAHDVAVLLDLVKTADVVVESFRPGVMQKLGLGFDNLSKINPKISLISITGYGQHGDWAPVAGHDINYMALSGQLHELCHKSGDIAIPNVQYGDLLGGAMTGAYATVCAVLHSKMHDVGCWMDVSMTASLLAHTVMPLFDVQSQQLPSPAGTALLNGGVPCYQVYRTQDQRYLAVGALELKFWQTFCQTVNKPDWVKQHWSLGSHSPCDAQAQALIDAVKQLISSQTLAHWTQLFATVDCCVTPVLRIDEALKHPANLAYGTVAYRQTFCADATQVPTVTAAIKRM